MKPGSHLLPGIFSSKNVYCKMKFFNLFKIIIAFVESVISIFKKDKAPVIDENIEADADRILKEIEAGEHVAPVEPESDICRNKTF